MFEQIINQGVLFYAIAGICGIGVFSSLIVNSIYGRLVKDSNNMLTPKTKLMKQMKQKFEGSYKLNESINNISVFIHKWMQKYKVVGISLHKLERVSFYMMGISLLVGVVGVYLAIEYEQDIATLINYIGAGVGSLLILISLKGIGDYTYKQEVIITNIRDYLENSLLNRLSIESKEKAKERRVRERQLEENIDTKPEFVQIIQSEEIEEIQERKSLLQAVNEKAIQAAAALQEKKLQEDIERMRQSMNEIAASKVNQNIENKEILKSMTPQRQEEVIREILKEFLA